MQRAVTSIFMAGPRTVFKAIRGYGDKVIGIIDREETYHGHTYFDLPILPIEDIDRSVNPYFIITAGDFDGIIDALSDLGYEAGKDFACSPDFRDYKILEEIRSTRVSLLLASSDYNDRTRARSSELGAGCLSRYGKSVFAEKNNWLFQAVCKNFV